LQRANVSLENLREIFRVVFRRAVALSRNSEIAEATRIEAIQLLGLATFAEAREGLIPLLDQNQSPAIHLAVVRALGDQSDASVALELSNRFAAMTPRLRSEVLTILLARLERITILLGAIERGAIQPSDLSSSQIQFLRNHRNTTIRDQAAKLFANVGM